VNIKTNSKTIYLIHFKFKNSLEKAEKHENITEETVRWWRIL